MITRDEPFPGDAKICIGFVLSVWKWKSKWGVVLSFLTSPCSPPWLPFCGVGGMFVHKSFGKLTMENTNLIRIFSLRELPFMTSALEGGGGPGKADKVREFSKGGCVKVRTRGGRGSKIRQICRRHK